MEKSCNGCATEKPSLYIPFAVHESAMARSERQTKRLIAVIVLLIVLLVGSNIGWLIYESQFETVATEEIIVDADENGVTNYIGNDGDIFNG